jgi:TRAP-type C4-dicarboxylate transport system permease small subunit
MSRETPSNDGLTDLARAVDAAARAADLQEDDDGAGRFGRAVNHVAEAAGVALLTVIVGVVFVNAVGRYALSFTFIWGDELVIGLMPWLGMIGMFLSIRRRQVIRIDFFVQAMPRWLRRALDVGGSLVAAAAFVYLAIAAFEWIEIFGGDRTIYLQLSKAWFMSAMLAGPALAVGAYLVLAWQDAVSRREGGL